jgi:hypothetical protein
MRMNAASDSGDELMRRSASLLMSNQTRHCALGVVTWSSPLVASGTTLGACSLATNAVWRLREFTADPPGRSPPARWRLSGSRAPLQRAEELSDDVAAAIERAS